MTKQIQRFQTVPALLSTDDWKDASLEEQRNTVERIKKLSSTPAFGVSESKHSALAVVFQKNQGMGSGTTD